MLGLLPGLAILSGKWRRANAQERQKLKRKSTRQLSTNTVAVDFEPPRLALMGGKLLPPLQLGPRSSVGLDITFLSDRLRICRGAGSATPFVFRMDTCAPGGHFASLADSWRAVVARQTIGARSFAAPLILAAIGAPLLLPRVSGVTVSLRRIVLSISLPFALAAAAVLRSTGGIVASPTSRE